MKCGIIPSCTHPLIHPFRENSGYGSFALISMNTCRKGDGWVWMHEIILPRISANLRESHFSCSALLTFGRVPTLRLIGSAWSGRRNEKCWRSGHAEPIRRSVGTRHRSETTMSRRQRKGNAIRGDSRWDISCVYTLPIPVFILSRF